MKGWLETLGVVFIITTIVTFWAVVSYVVAHFVLKYW